MKKTLSFLLSLLLMAGSIPAGNLSAGNLLRARADASSISDPGFEDDADIPGWTRDDGATGANLFVTHTEHSGGGSCLELYDPGSGYAPWLFSEEKAVTPGGTVTLEAMTKVASGTADLAIRYSDAAGNVLSYSQTLEFSVCGWEKKTISDTAPANAATACVYVFSGNAAAATAYFDDIRLSAADASDLANADFEDPGDIPGWTRDDGATEENLFVTDADHSEGGKCLELYDSGDGCAPWLYSSEINVASGDRIALSAFVKALNGTVALAIRYSDSDGNVLSYSGELDAADPEWTQKTLTDTAPDKAATACIFLFSGNAGAATAYYDDLSLTDTSAPADPDAVVDTDCSSLSSMQDGGWELPDNAEGLYVNDSGNTLGTPDTVSMKPADAGQFVLYHDAAADGGDPDSMLVMKAPDTANRIGGEDWTLTFRMKIADLMAMNSYSDPRAGMTMVVNTGSLITRVGFGADNRLRLVGADNSAQVSDRVNLHIGDGSYHTWTISGDASGTVYIACDGVGMAAFTGNSYAYDPVNEPYFSNPFQIIDYRSSAYSGGSTEVYFDSIRLSKGTLTKAPVLENLDFESAEDGDGNIPGWTRDDGATAEQVFETSEDRHGGSSSLKLTDAGSGYSPWLFSNPVSVNPGDTLSLSAWVNVTSGVAELSIQYTLADGSVKYADTDLNVTGGWTQVSLNGTAPADTTQARLFLWSGNAASATAYYDDISFTNTTDTRQSTGITTGAAVSLGDMVKGTAKDLTSLVAENPATGADEMYTVSTGSETTPSRFYVLDPDTGEIKWSQEIPNVQHLYAIVQGSDQNIYFAGCEGSGVLYRYLPAQQKIEKVADNPDNAWVWELAASSDGKIYGCTSETGSVFEFDIATGTMKNLGQVKEGATYARGLGVTDDAVYVGVGEPDAVYRIDRKTLEKTEIKTAASGDPNRMGSTVWIYNGRLFIRDNAMRLFVVDESTGQQINELSFQQAISAPSPYDDNLLYYKSHNALWEYDFSTNTGKEVADSPWLSDDASNALNWFRPASGPKAGRYLLGITDDAGGYVVYDPADNTVTGVSLAMQPQAVDIQSIEKSPDGRIYIGGYQFGAAVYNPSTEQVDYVEPNIDQPESIGFLNGKAYFGTYGSARIYSYDPSQPNGYTYGSGGNPGLSYDIGNDQDRPFVMTSAENKLFIGSVPDYGLLGGALTIFDEQTNQWSEYRNVVNNQSITGLACKDGLLYGGTSVGGGLGIDPSESEAKLFVWDVAKGEKVKEVSISIPGLKSIVKASSFTTTDKPQMIGALSFGPDGLLWGATDGALFAVDTTTMQVVKYQVVTAMDYTQDSLWRPYYLRWGADGLLYTTVGRKLVVFDTDTMAYDVLADYASLAVLGDDGDLYYASGSQLMKLPVIRTAAQTAAFTKGTARNAAKDAIDGLHGSYLITLADKPAVAGARGLVTAAEAAGVQDADISNLQKLVDCEAAVASIESGVASAVKAIGALPDAGDVRLSDKSAVEAARALVTSAKEAGAADADIPNLQKLADCEARIAAIGDAVAAAVQAIDALPEPSGLMISDKSAVVAARALVTSAKEAGATDADITNLQKLVDCEAAIAAMESNDTTAPSTTNTTVTSTTAPSSGDTTVSSETTTAVTDTASSATTDTSATAATSPDTGEGGRADWFLGLAAAAAAFLAARIFRRKEGAAE